MGFFCECLSSWGCSAHCSASGRRQHCSGAGVVALQGAVGIRSFSGRQRQEHGTLHPPLGSSWLLGSSSTTSKEFLLPPSVCPVAWIRGSGTQPRVWPFGNHKRKEAQGTSRAWGGTWDFLHGPPGVGALQEAKWHFSGLKARTIPAIKYFVPKERNQHHIHKIPHVSSSKTGQYTRENIASTHAILVLAAELVSLKFPVLNNIGQSRDSVCVARGVGTNWLKPKEIQIQGWIALLTSSHCT